MNEESCSVTEQQHSDDGTFVGTQELLDQPNVTRPTTVNTPVPTPSTYTDGRGEIHNILAGNKRINILYTNAGVARSGDIHLNTQHDFVFEGLVQVWFLEKNGETIKRTYGPYEYIRVPPLVPHVFHFLQDSVIAEWWEPEPFQAYFYTPYRRIVEESFSDSSKKGRLVKLVAEEENRSNLSIAVASFGGILLGVVAGFILGRRK